MSEENKVFVRTFLDAFASGDVETTKGMIADDHVFHFPFFDGPMERDAHADTQAGFVAAIPDLKFEVHDQIAEEDKVATRFTITGTFTAPFQDMKPNGEAIEFSGTNIMRIVDGKNVEEWDSFDTMALMGQMGAIHGAH